MAGRKPKPTAVKKLEGNPGKRKMNTKEPVPAKGMPTCPEWLLPEAKNEWKRLAELMNQMGVLTEVDMAAFAAYCQSYARWKEAQEHSYTSSDTSVATVDSDGTVTLKGAGETIIHVTFEKDDKYEGSGHIVFLTVTDNSSPSASDSDQNQNTDNDNHSSNSSNNSHHSSSKSETVEAPNPFVVYLQTQTSKIKNAKAGDTVIIESKSDLSFPLGFMKELQERKDITRKLSYNYKGLHYEITIPKGQAFVLDDSIPWYGPLKLSAMFGADITPVK